MVKQAVGDTNIFNITEPDRYRCQIHHYHNRLSRLYVRVFKDDNPQPAFYLLFTDVALLDCPINWQGADFGILPADTCIQLMLEAGLIGKAILQFAGAYASLTEHVRLYAVSKRNRPVQIIAGSASLLMKIPSELE